MADFFYGVIEGFYGRQWSWGERGGYAQFLAAQGFDCYIFAPKGEPALRQQWRQGIPQSLAADLSVLAKRYRQQGVRWGLGLSPLGLSEQFSAADRQALLNTVKQINQLQPDLLCILFDDMRGDIPGIARRQLDVVSEVLSHSRAAQHIVCPTYYSFDPVLEKVFGAMPADYLANLGEGLPAEVGVFWTGDRVIAEDFTEQSIDRARQALGRKPILWDNYPVNDGRLTSNFLHLQPYQGRPAALREWVDGHIVNPMNQAGLSRLVLASLADLYRHPGDYDPQLAWRGALASLQEPALAECINEDADLFQQCGLTGISAEQRLALTTRYRQWSHPVAAEIVDWLAGGYAFDPACLTG